MSQTHNIWRQTRFKEISQTQKKLSVWKSQVVTPRTMNLSLTIFLHPVITQSPLSCKMSLLTFLFCQFLHLLPSHTWSFSVQELSLMLLAKSYLNGSHYILLKNRKGTLKTQIPIVIHCKSSYPRTEQVKWPKLLFIFYHFLYAEIYA